MCLLNLSCESMMIPKNLNSLTWSIVSWSILIEQEAFPLIEKHIDTVFLMLRVRWLSLSQRDTSSISLVNMSTAALDVLADA